MPMCPFKGCDHSVPPKQWCCAPHWRGLDWGLQATVTAAQIDFVNGAIDANVLNRRLAAVLKEAEAGLVKTRRTD